MEALRSWLSLKEYRPWKTLLGKWSDFEDEYLTSKDDEDWNPWGKWCTSWETFENSNSKIPKSGKERVAVWRELYLVAKSTEKMLNKAKKERQTLKKQINLHVTCQSLEEKLNQEMQKSAVEAERHRQELERKASESLKLKKQIDDFQQANLLWKEECQSLQVKLNQEMAKNMREAQRHRQEMENEAVKLLNLNKQINDLLWEKGELEQEAAKLQVVQEQNNAMKYYVNQRLEEQRVDVKKVLREGLRMHMKLQGRVSNLEMEVGKLLGEKGQEIVKVREEMDWEIVNIFSGYKFDKYIVFSVDGEFIERFKAGEVSSHEIKMRPGVGCPSRKKLWNKLMSYEDPTQKVCNYTYWELVVHLSRYEDLVTGAPR